MDAQTAPMQAAPMQAAPAPATPPLESQTGIAIIGAGFSGLAMGIALLKAGRRDFVILEQAGDLGGTWRDNSYPGCACDVPSHLYSFSFAPNPDWSRMYAPAGEIWAYMRKVAADFGLMPFFRFGQGLKEARWDAGGKHWQVQTARGDQLTAQILISGVGALCVPMIPSLPGLDRFAGPAFHSARWRHDLDLTGKRIAVIGTGASAIQFVPQIQQSAGQVTLFQRTPPWVMEKDDRAMKPWEKRLFRLLPVTQRLLRLVIYWRMELRALGFTVNPKIMKKAEAMGHAHLARSIKDPELRAKLTPDYTMGCKRILISNDYFPALAKPNVSVETAGIQEVVADGIITEDGRHHPADVMIFGTGFRATEPLAGISITGEEGRSLTAEWEKAGGAEAYMGIAAAGFPNFFMLLGPNTGLGHNSIIFMIEAQVHYVMALLRRIAQKPGAAAAAKDGAQAGFVARIQDKIARTVWASGCKSWYIGASGKNSTIWPGFTVSYWFKTRKPDLSAFKGI